MKPEKNSAGRSGSGMKGRIPSAIDPGTSPADRAGRVKVVHPAGCSTLTRPVRPAPLRAGSTADGMLTDRVAFKGVRMQLLIFTIKRRRRRELRRHSAPVDRKCDAVDEAAIITCEEDDRRSKFLRLSYATCWC
jgi:hypothetical protein